MIDSGGMPSSHSATVTALAVTIGLQEGTGASSFAIAVVFACVVCYLKPGFILLTNFSCFQDDQNFKILNAVDDIRFK